MTAALARNADLGHDPFERAAVVGLAGRDKQAERPPAAFTSQVDFAGQATTRASEPFVGTVPCRDCPFLDPFVGAALRAPAACW
ncbi:hypothetical protein GCM10010440_35920 [Kitasatospora cinereorecta]